jgi:hypothetical protein
MSDRGQQLAEQMRGVACCARPIRLAGHIDHVDPATGEVRRALDTSSAPAGALLVACGNRRATACPACAETYRGDAWQLIAAGLSGGKGVPADVATRPRVFVTLTAPSFGPVHSRRMRNGQPRLCRSRRHGTCQHGAAKSCRVRHAPDDALLGQPLCAECFDYTAAVLWNVHASALWNRTVIAVRRQLARHARLSVKAWSRQARLSFIKVVEYQDRGAVHVHAIFRLDPADPRDACSSPTDANELAEAIRRAVTAAEVAVQLPDGSEFRARWGAQADIRPLSDDVRRAGAVAAYIAKYATKSSDAAGALDKRIRRLEEVERLAINQHLRRLVRECWRLGAMPQYRKLRLRAWAHTLGYRGHWTTKSHRYSTTFSELRDARRRHAAGDEPDEVVLAQLSYAGRGYQLGTAS